MYKLELAPKLQNDICTSLVHTHTSHHQVAHDALPLANVRNKHAIRYHVRPNTVSASVVHKKALHSTHFITGRNPSLPSSPTEHGYPGEEAG